MTFLHLSRQSVRYKSDFCIGKLLLGLGMVSAIRNIEVSVNQGLICMDMHLRPSTSVRIITKSAFQGVRNKGFHCIHIQCHKYILHVHCSQITYMMYSRLSLIWMGP